MRDMLEVKERIAPEMVKHFEVWTDNGIPHWNIFHIDGLVIPAIEQRPAYARQYLNEYFEFR